MEGDETAANQYTYWLDMNSFKKEGVYHLYRNEIKVGKYVHSDYLTGSPEDMPLIAKGFTAILGQKFDFKSDKVYIEVINIHGKGKVFNDYFHEQVNPIIKKYNDLPELLNENEIFIKAVEEHLSNERLFLNESSNFYNENLLKNEDRLKSTIKAYVINYLEWVGKKISSEKPKSDLKMKASISDDTLNTITEDLVNLKIIFSDEHYLFKSIFKGFSVDRKVRWNGDVRNAKFGLFALIYHLTGRKVKASELKNYFEPISMNNSYKITDGQYGKMYKDVDEGLLFTTFTDKWFPR